MEAFTVLTVPGNVNYVASDARKGDLMIARILIIDDDQDG